MTLARSYYFSFCCCGTNMVVFCYGLMVGEAITYDETLDLYPCALKIVPILNAFFLCSMHS